MTVSECITLLKPPLRLGPGIFAQSSLFQSFSVGFLTLPAPRTVFFRGNSLPGGRFFFRAPRLTFEFSLSFSQVGIFCRFFMKAPFPRHSGYSNSDFLLHFFETFDFFCWGLLQSEFLYFFSPDRFRPPLLFSQAGLPTTD